jgi:hypothetical protein
LEAPKITIGGFLPKRGFYKRNFADGWGLKYRTWQRANDFNLFWSRGISMMKGGVVERIDQARICC